MSINNVEELREKLLETEEALALAEQEEEKREALRNGEDVEDEEPELVNPGIDDFKVDSRGRIWCGGEEIGGPDIIDDRDPSTASAFKSLELSPRDQQLIGERIRDDQGRFAAAPAPEQPLWTEPCTCGDCVDIRKANIIGAAWDTRNGQAYVRHLCRCGEERLTIADDIPEPIQRRALDEAEIMETILTEYMPEGWNK